MVKKTHSLLFHSLQILVLLLLTAAAWSGYSALSERMEEAAEAIKERIIGSVEDGMAVRLEYSRIAPSFLSTVTIENLKVYSEGSSEPLLVIKKLKAHHNVIGLLFRGDTAVRSLTATGVTIDMDTGRDSAFLEKIAADSGAGNAAPTEEGGFSSLGDLFTRFIRIRNWDISVRHEDITAEGRGNSITIRQLGEYIRMNLKGQISYSSEAEGALVTFAALETSLRGTVQNDLKAFSLNTDFQKIDSNLAVLENQRLNINYRDDEFRITKIKDNKPYDFNLTINDEQIRLALLAEDFSPSNLVYFRSDLEDLNPWLETSISGEGEFSIQRETGFLAYSYKGSLGMNNPDALPFPLTLTLDVEGDDLHVVSDEMRIDSEYGSLNREGQWVYQNAFPEGYVYLSNVLLGDSEKLSGRLSFRNIDEYLSVRSDYLRLSDGSSPGNLKMLLYQNESNYVFSVQSSLESLSSHRNIIILDGSFSLAQGFALKTSFRVADMAVSSIYPYLPDGTGESIDSILPELMLQSEGSFGISSDGLMVQVSRFQTFVPDGSRRLSFTGFYGGGVLDLYNSELIWDGNYLVGTGQADLSTDQVIVNSSWDLNNNKFDLNAAYLNGQLSMLGSHGLKLQMARQGSSSLLASLEVQDFPLTWSGQDFTGSLTLRGRYEKENWEIFLRDSVFRWTNSELLTDPELKVTAFVAPGAVNLFSVNYSDAFSSLAGEGGFFYDTDLNIYNGSLSLKEDGAAGEPEAYDLYGAFSDGNLSLTLQLEQARTARYASLGMEGRVDSSFSIQGALTSPMLSGSIDASEMVLNGMPFALHSSIRMSPEKLEIYDLNIRNNNLYLKRGLGVFDFKDGSLVFTSALDNGVVRVDDDDPRMRLETGVSLRADTGVVIDFGNFEMPALGDFNGRFRIHPIKWNDITTFASKTIDFSRRGADFESVLLEDTDQFLRFNSDSGKLTARLKEDFPIAMKVDGTVSPDSLDLNLEEMIVDLHMINYVMPRDNALGNRFVVFNKGSRMEGSAHIGGTPGEPVFNGKLSSRDLYVLTPYTDSEIKETYIEATVTDDLVQTNEFFIPIGRGGVRAQGYMNMQGWGIRDFSLDIALEGNPGTPVVYNAYNIQGTGAITGNFRFFGDTKQGNFVGRVVVEELVGSIGESTVIKSYGEPAPIGWAFRLDLDIVTGKNVLFVLPNPQVELVRAMAEPGERLNISVDTMNKTFSMTGGVSIRDGVIYYFDQTFEINEGSLTFNEDQDTFNPFMNVEAEIETSDANGNDVLITLEYRNPVMDEFKANLRSTPSMPEEEITALFGQSLIPVDSTTGQVDVSSLLVATGGMVSQYGFVRPIEQSIKETLNLDSVTIRTEILENALLDQLNRESTVADAGTVFSMAKYLDNTSLYLGKYAGESLYFSLGWVVDYDQLYGIGSYLNGIKIVPDLTVEMRTPFFLVYWNYNKRNAFDTYNTDMMKNNAIGLEWRYSY
ncbi:MAG: translocation/assembly module TamB domain-containing protein [Spirochaetales bacterium]|nr:translocation/assembly module TamB domain-containing protein [Spirochaetales bacterium]